MTRGSASFLRILALAPLIASAGCGTSNSCASRPWDCPNAAIGAIGGTGGGSSANVGGGASGGRSTIASGGTNLSDAGPEPTQPLENLQRRFVDLRFGMFLHFGILTYTGSWAQDNLDITQFNPTALDPGQWADAAVSANMKFGVLTTRHHDGFALWDSKVSDF